MWNAVSQASGLTARIHTPPAKPKPLTESLAKAHLREVELLSVKPLDVLELANGQGQGAVLKRDFGDRSLT